MHQPETPFRLTQQFPYFGNYIVNNRELPGSFTAQTFLTDPVLDGRLKEGKIILVIHLRHRKAVGLTPGVDRLGWFPERYGITVQTAQGKKEQDEQKSGKPSSID